MDPKPPGLTSHPSSTNTPRPSPPVSPSAERRGTLQSQEGLPSIQQGTTHDSDRSEDKSVQQREVYQADTPTGLQLTVSNRDSPAVDSPKKTSVAPGRLYQVTAPFEEKLNALMDNLIDRKKKLVQEGIQEVKVQIQESEHQGKREEKTDIECEPWLQSIEDELSIIGKNSLGYYPTLGTFLLHYKENDPEKYKKLVDCYFSRPGEDESAFIEYLEYLWALDSDLPWLPSGEPVSYVRAVELAHKMKFLPLIWSLGKLALVPHTAKVSPLSLLSLLIRCRNEASRIQRTALVWYAATRHDWCFAMGKDDKHPLSP